MAKSGAAVAIVLVLVAVGAAMYLGVIPNPFSKAPAGSGLFESQITLGSTDSTSTQQIAADGHSIRFSLTAANFHTLGNVEIRVSVQNKNSGAGAWVFVASLMDCGRVKDSVSGQWLDACAQSGGRRDVSFALVNSGAPTGSQQGETFTSRDWSSGAADVLVASMNIDTSAMANTSQGASFDINYEVGGVGIVATVSQIT